jgi:hypothetical protein
MQGKAKEYWLQLCEQVAVEQDTDRMIELVRELNRILEEKEQRLERERSKRAAGAYLRLPDAADDSTSEHNS